MQCSMCYLYSNSRSGIVISEMIFWNDKKPLIKVLNNNKNDLPLIYRIVAFIKKPVNIKADFIYKTDLESMLMCMKD